jgi:CRISPR-associated protein Cas1
MEVVVKDYGVFLGYSRGALVVRKRGRGEVKRVPLHQVDRIWILTSGVAISSRLVRALSRNLIDVVFFDGRGEPVARLLPPDSNGSQKGAARGVFQRQEFELAKLVVNGKVAGQGPQTRRPVEAGALRRACKSRRRGGWRRRC